jgi:hypothetical protein
MTIQTGVAYFEGRAPRHTSRDLDDMVDSGCSYVIHCYSEFDVRYSPDSMRRLVADTRAHGLGVWLDPWGVGEVFGGEPFSRFGAVHPEARQVGSNGLANTHACLNQPAFRAWVHDWVDAAAVAGAETIFWDEPTWEIRGDVWSCRCERCQALFRERTGAAMPVEFVPEVKLFLEDSMADLLSDACTYARAKGLDNALCIMPPEASNPGFTDWDRAASIEGLDNFGTDPYWYSFGGDPAEFVGRHTRATIEVADRHGLDHHVWVQAFEVPSGREAEIGVAIDAAADAGARNIAAWSYDGCAAMSSCECNRPEEAWKVVADGFRRVRSRR